MNIDKKKYFSVKVDDVDQAQATGSLVEMFGSDGMYQLANAVDAEVAKLANKASVSVVAGENMAHSIIDLATAMDEANVPTMGRWLVITPAVKAELIKALPTISTGENTFNVARANFVGEYAGFQIFVSNNVVKKAVTGEHLCLAGVAQSGAIALQIEKVRALQDPTSFAEKVEGLTVFGCDVRETEEGKSNKIAVLEFAPKVALRTKTTK